MCEQSGSTNTNERMVRRTNSKQHVKSWFKSANKTMHGSTQKKHQQKEKRMHKKMVGAGANDGKKTA